MKLLMATLGALFAAVAAAVEVETLNGSNPTFQEKRENSGIA